jgi:adenine-specific DNA-methyltransferase
MPTKRVETLKHKDKRTNIPTEELRDFVAEEERAPKKILYPRDPSLDPQLVWKGKDEQDAKPLEVPAVPIYIQEKIHPQAIIEELRAQRNGESREPQYQMFADFNGLPDEFEKRVDFYHWDQNWSNRMILGDSLMVMTSLAEKEGLKGKVQAIYIDPPYGIRFGSNWQVSTRRREVKDGKVEDATRQPEQVKAFRDTWEKGIHSYLAYLRDRLFAAHQLLIESGSIFIQIGEENLHLVRSLLDEVFGSENVIAVITFVKTSAQEDLHLPSVCDYVLWYAKDKTVVKFRSIWIEKTTDDPVAADYSRVDLADGIRRGMTVAEQADWSLLPAGARPYSRDTIVSQRPPGGFPVQFEGAEFRPLTGYWKSSVQGMERLVKAGRVERRGRVLRYVRFFGDFAVRPVANFWTDVRFSSRSEDKIYVVQTASRVVQRCILMTTDPGDLVLDPTGGSGTTAYIAEHWGRRWISMDTSRVAMTLARTRLMAARFPYFLLADSPEGVRKEAEITGNPPNGAGTAGDVKKGFVYKRVPHITLKSIANNEEIDQIHARYQQQLEPLRAELNKVLKQKWGEWEVPRDTDQNWPEKARTVHEQRWKLRRQRQQEIDASIASRVDSELLYDRSYEDSSCIRVTGPFTVESLSPHRVISTDDDQPDSEAKRRAEDTGSFERMIIDNLRKAGVQNTVKQERLKFDRLESYAGTWLQAAGEYTEGKKAKRVAVCIGPEYGTVGPELVKEAAKEAVQGVGFDLLIVCGFAFDPHVSEETKRYGKLAVLIARMNPDLSMGDELLKKTGAGNLFMVFGEPDLDIQPQKDGNLVVTLKGVDVYDPTTGQIRNSSTDDVACWFIDTDYNGESFFVRHAYFTGAGDPYEKLKKALRAEIDEAAWSTLYSTVSRPFPAPKGKGKQPGKIAVKVINHYGDEVLKVYEVTRAEQTKAKA